jgi:hypothetical protein
VLDVNRLTSSQIVYRAAGHIIDDYEDRHCHLCAGGLFSPVPSSSILKTTFTNHDKTTGSGLICAACAWTLSEPSPELTTLTGKDKPQRLRNYSHFVVDGRWTPLSKGNKAAQAALLASPGGLPEVAAVAVSGQRHLLFRTPSNPSGQGRGWVMLEEEALWVDQSQFSTLVAAIQILLTARYSKESIRTGRYIYPPEAPITLDEVATTDNYLREYRGGGVFALALFLATIEEEA